MKIIRTLFFYTVVILIGIVTILPCMVFALLPEKIRYDNPLYYWCMCIFYKVTVRALCLPIKIIGQENIPHEPAIIAANHQSALDIPLVGNVLHCYPNIWFFKHELLSVPFLGFLGKRMGISVDPSTPHKALLSLRKALKIFDGKKKRDLIIFPEAGRYTDGKIHEFLKGFSLLAKKTNCPLVPIFIEKVNKVYPPGSFYINYSPITIIIGKPFIIEPHESDADFTRRVRAWFISHTITEQ
jgi:1-acyl-sn-glycerol-3-phosphate acyltransferase